MVELTKVVKRKAGERWVAIYLTLKIIRKERNEHCFFIFWFCLIFFYYPLMADNTRAVQIQRLVFTSPL